MKRSFKKGAYAIGGIFLVAIVGKAIWSESGGPDTVCFIKFNQYLAEKMESVPKVDKNSSLKDHQNLVLQTLKIYANANVLDCSVETQLAVDDAIEALEEMNAVFAEAERRGIWNTLGFNQDLQKRSQAAETKWNAAMQTIDKERKAIREPIEELVRS